MIRCSSRRPFPATRSTSPFAAIPRIITPRDWSLWKVASAMAALDADEGRIDRIVLLDAVGALVPGEPVRDVSGLHPRDLARHSWHDPERFLATLAAMPPEALRASQQNQVALQALAGDPYLHGPALLDPFLARTGAAALQSGA